MDKDNRKALDKGFGTFKSMMRTQMLDCLTRSAYALLVDAETSKEYHNLTGNTLTSYMVGIYENGKLRRIVSILEADALRKPTSRKLTSGKGIAIVEDYDSGRFIPVKRYKLVDTDEDYGYNTSKRFLASYRPSVTKGFGIVMCTGTEYSEYLEASKRLNTLTGTFQIAPRTLLQNLKPIA